MAAASTDTGVLKVSGVGKGATVKAYKIVKANYNDSGFTGWEAVIAYSISDTTTWMPTASELNNIVKQITAENSTVTTDVVTLTYDETTQTYASPAAGQDGAATAGEYVVLVEKTDSADALVYNPAVVSTYYDGSTLVSEPTGNQIVAIDKNHSFGTGNDAYVKASEITVTKKIANPDGDASGNKTGEGEAARADGDDLQVGDTGDFEIKTKIPSYSSAYKNLKFELTDTQDDGFDAPTSIKVTVAGTVVYDGDNTTQNNTAVEVAVNGNDFTVKFKTDEFILANAGKDVVVTYSAKLNRKATQKTAANKDKVELEYTKDIKENTDKKDDTVYEYSFPVDVLKVDSEALTTTEDGKTYHQDSDKKYHLALQGAEFTLTRVSPEPAANTDHVDYGDTTDKKVATTNEQGIATFNHLDEGIYKIEETKAPTSPKTYKASTETFYIKVTPVYYTANDTKDGVPVTNDDIGTLKTYTVTQCNEDGSPKTDTSDASLEERSNDNANDTLVVNDSPAPNLPATGARSALILTVCGAALMITVMAASKRKKEVED